MIDQSFYLAEAYQRLLGELSRRLGAVEARLLLRTGDDDPPAVVASYNPDTALAESRWLDIPICEGTFEVGRLRLAFAPGAPLPGSAERGLIQAFVELAALLVEEHHHHTWAPLRQAGRRMLAVNEEELQRVILDIHDGPVQKLFVVSSNLALLEAQIGDLPEGTRRDLEPVIQRLSRLVEDALQEIKTTLSVFRPAEFQRRSLASVLHGLAMQHEAYTGNQIDLHFDDDVPSVSLHVKIALYRVLQEALSNAYRHGGVDRHAVWLGSQDGWVVMEVVDQGQGFEPPPLEGPAATEREEHIGLRGMRERVHLVGGQFRVISRPGHGTRVIVRVPSDG